MKLWQHGVAIYHSWAGCDVMASLAGFLILETRYFYASSRPLAVCGFSTVARFRVLVRQPHIRYSSDLFFQALPKEVTELPISRVLLVSLVPTPSRHGVVDIQQDPTLRYACVGTRLGEPAPALRDRLRFALCFALRIM
jgi:hypothetical protein